MLWWFAVPTTAWRRTGGCDFAEDPSVSADQARLFWREDVQLGQIVVDAVPVCSGDPDSIDFCSLDLTKRILVDEKGAEHWMLSSCRQEIALRVRSGTLLAGPVRLNYALSGITRLEPQLATLRVLVALARRGRLPQPQGTGGRLDQWFAMLRSLDALAEGANTRDVGTLIFGEDTVRREWDGPSDFLRSRVRRLIRGAQAMRDSGYRMLLR